jgi:hypothetical protein
MPGSITSRVSGWWKSFAVWSVRIWIIQLKLPMAEVVGSPQQWLGELHLVA